MLAPISVFLIDDDQGVTLSLLAALGRPDSGFAPCGATASGESALAMIEGSTVDLFIVDLILPGGMDGIEFISRLKTTSPHSRAVLLTGYPSHKVTLRALAAGADGILHKPFEIHELLRSLHAAYRGHCAVTAEATQHLVEHLRALGGLDSAADDGPLTKREVEVMRLLGTGKTAKEVAAETGLSPETVTTYRKNAFKKLNVHKLPEAMIKLRGGGRKW